MHGFFKRHYFLTEKSLIPRLSSFNCFSLKRIWFYISWWILFVVEWLQLVSTKVIMCGTLQQPPKNQWQWNGLQINAIIDVDMMMDASSICNDFLPLPQIMMGCLLTSGIEGAITTIFFLGFSRVVERFLSSLNIPVHDTAIEMPHALSVQGFGTPHTDEEINPLDVHTRSYKKTFHCQ